jgi:hypothetical protein
MIKNPTQLLVQATQLPAAIEGKLPSGAPKLSTTLTDVANKLPKLPDLPMELPDLPAPPQMPGSPVTAALKPKNYVAGVEVTPVASAVKPATSTGKKQFVFE